MRRRTVKKHIPLYDIHISRDVKREVMSALDSGWLSSGPRVADFEAALADYTGVRYQIAVSSATAGLIASLEAVEVRGKEVVTTPYSFVATVEAIIRSGGTPVFADIDPHTLAIDPDEAERKMCRRTACILPIDIAGYPADYARLRSLARDTGVALVSDASHSFGARYRGKPVSAYCDAAVFSFHATKNLTCGEGGLVACRRRDIAAKARLIARHGVSATAYDRRVRGRWAYDVKRLGFKANMSEIHAAIGMGNLRRFDMNQAKRRRLAERYRNNLADLSNWVELPPSGRHIEAAWHLYIIKLNLDRLRITRDRFIQLMSEAGVECGVHFVPINRFSFFRDLGIKRVECPNSDQAGERVVTLPLFQELKPSEIDYVCERIQLILKKYRA